MNLKHLTIAVMFYCTALTLCNKEQDVYKCINKNIIFAFFSI